MGRVKTLKIGRVDLPPGVSRIVFLGDPHGDLDTVQKIVSLESREDTLIACVGDVVGYTDGPTSSALCAYLESLKIPTTEGNHEDWTGDDGKLAIAPKYCDKKLTWEATRWIRSLPQIIEFYSDDYLVCKMTHSIFHPDWDWINEKNIHILFAQLGNPAIVITGHSHRPGYYFIEPTKKEYFNFVEHKSMDICISGQILLDAGSVGRPEYVGRSENPMSSRIPRNSFGTYAVLDINSYTAQLRSIKKQEDSLPSD